MDELVYELQQLKNTKELEKQKDTALIPANVKTKNLEKYERIHRRWQGIPAIAITKNGIMYCACYSGGNGEGKDNYVLVERSKDGGQTWSEPIAVVDPEGYVRAFDACLWVTPNNELALFWNQSFGGFDGRAGVFLSICKNPEKENLCWTSAIRITDGVMLNKPIIGEHGEWLLSLSLWNNVESDFNQDCTDRMIKVYATSDKGVSFYKMGEFTMPGRYYDEPMTVQHKDGTLHMLVRLPDGIGEAFSKDGGKNWGHIQKSKFWGPNSRFYFGRLMSGNLLLVNHQIEREDEESKETLFPKRSHLSAWLSEDDGLTWSKPFLLDEREGISYPDVDQDEEGNIYIIYDYLRFKEKQLLLAKITEEDILNGQIKTMGSYLRKGMSWGQAGTTFVAKKIRNPQVVGFEHLYFLHGRSGNNGEQAGNFVLYCSEDGIHWDEGRYLKVRTEGLGAYSNNLVIGKGTSHEKLLIQASHAYKDNQTNVLHWQIIKRKV